MSLNISGEFKFIKYQLLGVIKYNMKRLSVNWRSWLILCEKRCRWKEKGEILLHGGNQLIGSTSLSRITLKDDYNDDSVNE